MDIKSILRTFRYTEMQQKSERDPAAKRPPTIKFLAVALFIGLMAFGFAMLVMSYESEGGDGTLMSVSDSSDTANATSTSPTPTASESPVTQAGPQPRIARSD